MLVIPLKGIIYMFTTVREIKGTVAFVANCVSGTGVGG